MQVTEAQTALLRHRHMVIVDNDALTLQSLRALIRQKLPMFVIDAAYGSGRAALEHTPQPDLWLVDMSMEGMQGTSLCRLIRQNDDHTPILAMTSFSVARYREPAITAGCQGLIDKSSLSQFLEKIPKAGNGWVEPDFESPLTAHLRLMEEHRHTDAWLTPRETDIIELSAQGCLDAEIGAKLEISEATVRKHMQHILKKLHASTARQAVAFWLNRRM